MFGLRLTCALVLSALFPLVGIGQTAAEWPWSDEVKARLELAGTNRAAIATALREVPAALGDAIPRGKHAFG